MKSDGHILLKSYYPNDVIVENGMGERSLRHFYFLWKEDERKVWERPGACEPCLWHGWRR